jgi:hypothetical protein
MIYFSIKIPGQFHMFFMLRKLFSLQENLKFLHFFGGDDMQKTALGPISLEMQFSVPAGAKIFCDAAFNPTLDANVAGLGVFMHEPEKKIKLCVGAISLPSPLFCRLKRKPYPLL